MQGEGGAWAGVSEPLPASPPLGGRAVPLAAPAWLREPEFFVEDRGARPSWQPGLRGGSARSRTPHLRRR